MRGAINSTSYMPSYSGVN